VPLASIIMACEMCSSYTLLVPLMLVSCISIVLLGRTTLYEKQMISRIVSPAHVAEYARGLLNEMYVYQAVNQQPLTLIPEKTPFSELIKTVTSSPEAYFPTVDEQGKMTGIISINDIREVLFEESLKNIILAKDVATPNVVRVSWNDTLQDALDKMAALKIDELPVVREEAPDKIVAMISKQDIISYYHSRSEA